MRLDLSLFLISVFVSLEQRAVAFTVNNQRSNSPLPNTRNEYRNFWLFSSSTDNQSTDGQDGNVSDSPEVVQKKDEELEAIKDEISKLEMTLKNKRRELASIDGLVDQYSKAGYARKVAEMDGFRKTKMAAQSDDKSALKAAVLQDFLPILERLNELNDEYASNNFAVKNYSTLSTSYAGALKALGLNDYSVDVGSKVDTSRATVVQEEISDMFPEAGHVISVVKKGYDVNGHVVRAAEVVASASVDTKDE